MKMNWGKILMLVMLAFMALIVTLGIRMARSGQSLYEEEYYEKGEQHEDRLIKERTGLAVELSYNAALKSIELIYDSTGYFSEMLFRNLADENRDFMLTGKKRQKSHEMVNVASIAPGNWVVECKGMVNGKEYFKKFEFIK